MNSALITRSITQKNDNRPNPKVLALSVMLSALTPACSDNKPLQNDIFEPKVETYRTLDKMGRDRKEIHALIWHLKTAMNIDSAKVEIVKENKFKVKSRYLNNDVQLTINIIKGKDNTIAGAYSVKGPKDNQPRIFPYHATYDDNIKDIKITYKTVEGMPEQKCTLHRNDNGKLFIIKEDGDIEQIKQ